MQADKPVFGTRWSVVAGGFLLALMGGLSYSWGVFLKPLEEQLGWTKTQSMMPLSVFMVVFAVMMIPAGRLQERHGTRKMIILGAFLFLLANGLSALLHIVAHPIWLVGTYGLIGGTACGITYSCIAPSIRRWFPDYPGLAVALGVMGFGLASFIFAPLKAQVIIPAMGIDGTFIVLAVVTFVITLVASILVVFPTDEWYMHLFGSMHLPDRTGMVRANMKPRQMLHTSLFWLIWSSFLLSIYGSLLIIGILPSYGAEVVGLSGGQAALPLSIYALVNGLSRPLAGFISDRIGVLRVLAVVFFVQAVVFLLFPSQVLGLRELLIASAALGIGIGSSLALYPVLSSECFGVEHMGINYGLLFTAYGFGALAIQGGTLLREISGTYAPALLLAGAMSLLSAILVGYIQIRYKLS